MHLSFQGSKMPFFLKSTDQRLPTSAALYWAPTWGRGEHKPSEMYLNQNLKNLSVQGNFLYFSKCLVEKYLSLYFF